MCLKPEKKDICCLQMSNILKEAKYWLQYKIKPPSFKSLENNNGKLSQSLETITSKDISLPINIVLMQGITMEEVSHDLFDFSITTKTNKSLIVAEIEKALLLTTAVTELKKKFNFIHSQNNWPCV